MNAERQNAAAVFAEALKASDPAERQTYLDRACAGNQTLRQEVESLLRAHEQAGGFLSKTKPLSPSDFAIEKTGMMIGRYKLLEQIGEGGFGVVYMAEQVEPVHRRVALKIIKAGMDTKEIIARFEAERQALALMDHPNIARVLDAGATQAGRPYFVMELVRGIRITDYCDRHNLSTGERLELFIQVCRAVQHAHQKGIIHRDLKPSNILVTTPDGVPVPKVIDFGIAKAIAQRLTDKTLFTAFTQFIGTPAYISPEQAEITALDVDTRSDIYSLGVLLYELLTGQTPFDAERLVKAGMEAMRRIIREDEPPRPSTRLSTLGGDALTEVARHRHAEPPRLIHSVRGDLDWIVMKCLEKDRRRRYESASGLAMDVERHLRAEPVEAAPPSIGYRIQKLAVRHRMSLSVAAVVLAAIMVVAASIGWVARDRQARQAAFDQKVAIALDDARKAYLRDDLAGVRAAVRSAEALLETGTAGQGIADSVHQWRTDLDLVKRLDAIHENSLVAIIQSRSRIAGMGDDRAIARETDQAYREAFDHYALPLERMSDARAAERMSASLIKGHLVVALDHWAVTKWIQGTEGSARLLGIAQQVQPDPWRGRVRAALIGGKREDLLALASDADIVNSTPLFMKMFAAILDGAGERAQAIRLMRLAQQSNPDDYWINFLLSFLLWNMGDYKAGVGYGRAAVALRPDAWAAHGTLAHNLALGDTLREQEAAEFHCRQAIRLNPEQPWHYLMLVETLSRQQSNHGKVVDTEELDALYEKHLELMPALYQRAIEQRPEDHWLWFQAAALHLHHGETEAYRHCCAEMLKRFGETDDAVIAERTAKTCLLAPGAVEDLQPVLKLSEFAVNGTEEREGYPWFVTVRALADYRGSRFDSASEWLERCRPKAAVCLATVASIRAMTLQQLGRTAEARRSLIHARTLFGQHPFRQAGGVSYELCDWVRAKVLYREAVEILGRPEEAASTPNKD